MKDSFMRIKRQASGKEEERIYANHIFDKELVSKIPEDLSKLTVKKMEQSN